MTEARDIFWMAGLLEGEGCFMYRNGCPSIQLSMTDKDIVKRGAKILGVGAHTPYKRDDGHKWVYACVATGTTAIGWMMTVYSLMGERRRSKIKNILEQWKASPRRPRAPNGKPFMATCHPNRRQDARGLCAACYMKRWRLSKKNNLPLARVFGGNDMTDELFTDE